MASPSERADQVKEAGSSQSGAMGGLGEAEIHLAPAIVSEQASSSSPGVLSGAEKYHPGSVAQQIEQSRRHWSELSDSTWMPDSKKKPFQRVRNLAARIFGGEHRSDEEIAVEMDNRKVFMELQSHPSWGFFFKTFGYTLGTPSHGKPGFRYLSAGVLRVGEKFAEGAQAELFHVDITWSSARARELMEGIEYVMKVFKKGTLLRDLQSQWPLGYLQFIAEEVEKWESPTYKGSLIFVSGIGCGTLCADGRFAFVMIRKSGDLRTMIDSHMIFRTNQDSNMISSTNQECGPFSKGDAGRIMWNIAKGMEWLHSHNIVHRDLKASNVLVETPLKGAGKALLVADYECSVGVVGTNFFRAPEILQACKDGLASRKPELYTKAVDVYSYGMTCYEILTGKLPFEDHLPYDYDHVLNGDRPELPPYVDGWTCELLRRCWDVNPRDRPSFAEILNILVANSLGAQEMKIMFDANVEELTLDNRTNPDVGDS